MAFRLLAARRGLYVTGATAADLGVKERLLAPRVLQLHPRLRGRHLPRAPSFSTAFLAANLASPTL